MKLTNVSGLFNSCRKITGPIPETLFTGSKNIINTSVCFQYCDGLTGSIPKNMFKGITGLQNASYMFNGCSQLSGDLPDNLFADCPNINDIRRIFHNDIGILGTLKYNMFQGCTKLTNMDEAFAGTKISGIEKDTFKDLTSLFAARYAFRGTKIRNVPSGLLDNIKSGVLLNGLFAYSEVHVIGSDIFSNMQSGIHIHGLFAGNPVWSSLPNAYTDWSDKDKIWQYSVGVFGGCTTMPDYNTIPLELGGKGDRKFPDSKYKNVGKLIVSPDNDQLQMMDPNEYDAASSTDPTLKIHGVVYTDVCLDKSVKIPATTNVISSGDFNSTFAYCKLNSNGKFFDKWIDWSNAPKPNLGTPNQSTFDNRQRYFGAEETDIWIQYMKDNPQYAMSIPTAINNYKNDNDAKYGVSHWIMDGSSFRDICERFGLLYSYQQRHNAATCYIPRTQHFATSDDINGINYGERNDSSIFQATSNSWASGYYMFCFEVPDSLKNTNIAS